MAKPVASTVVSETTNLSSLIGQLVSNQPTGKGTKQTSLGISATALLRFLGAQDVKPKLAASIMAKVCEQTVSKNTIQSQLASGRRGEKVPTLSKEQQDKLGTAIAPLVNGK